jgi:hypothetical protein
VRTTSQAVGPQVRHDLCEVVQVDVRRHPPDLGLVQQQRGVDVGERRLADTP